MENTTIIYRAATRESIGRSIDDLVLAAQKGDLESFNQLVLLYQGRIFNLAVRISGDVDLAEDITQNTFLSAFRCLPRFRNGSFYCWLYRIATNACYDEHRRRKKHPVMSLEYADDVEERTLPHYNVSSHWILPEKEYERHEIDHVVQQALNQLDADQRTVIVLVDLQEFDYQEAARVLGVPIGTVKSRLARGRLQLQQFLSEFENIKLSV